MAMKNVVNLITTPLLMNLAVGAGVGGTPAGGLSRFEICIQSQIRESRRAWAKGTHFSGGRRLAADLAGDAEEEDPRAREITNGFKYMVDV